MLGLFLHPEKERVEGEKIKVEEDKEKVEQDKENVEEERKAVDTQLLEKSKAFASLNTERLEKRCRRCEERDAWGHKIEEESAH